MPKRTYEPAIPTRGTAVPAGPGSLHENKQDGFRMIVIRDDARVRLFTRNGHDWTDRYPWIVESARKIRTKQFVLDGEAVILGVDGISDFAALMSGKQNDDVQFMPLTCWPGRAATCRNCRYRCGRQTCNGCWLGDRKASLYRPWSRARSGRTCS